MKMIWAKSPSAAAALILVRDLQQRLARQLILPGDAGRFAPVSWQRDEGRHGGGERLGYRDGKAFNRASLNVSQVHYDDEPTRPLESATALSSIVHPQHPLAPSLHLHISWTTMKAGTGYWRLMADLNPAIDNDEDKESFKTAIRGCIEPLYDHGLAQGDRYFFIPALQRHRGIVHFYLEQFHSGNPTADEALAQNFGRAVIDAYTKILASKNLHAPTASELNAQLAYHTLYLFQVLTLDRGTTSGLLVHDQNDLGILGSLPARVDTTLLRRWESQVEKPQDELVRAIIATLPADGAVEDAEKIALCNVVRQHYKKHPKALEMQARGDVLPPTMQNHTMQNHRS